MYTYDVFNDLMKCNYECMHVKEGYDQQKTASILPANPPNQPFYRTTKPTIHRTTKPTK